MRNVPRGGGSANSGGRGGGRKPVAWNTHVREVGRTWVWGVWNGCSWEQRAFRPFPPDPSPRAHVCGWTVDPPASVAGLWFRDEACGWVSERQVERQRRPSGVKAPAWARPAAAVQGMWHQLRGPCGPVAACSWLGSSLALVCSGRAFLSSPCGCYRLISNIAKGGGALLFVLQGPQTGGTGLAEPGAFCAE